jgi:serine/threonine protein kinase
MTPDRWRRVQEVFAAATEREFGSRETFLEEVCRNDPELRIEVESLLASLGAASSGFLESPAIEAVAPLETAGSRSLGKGKRLGPYEILGTLGAGGMGEVYRASDSRLGREVAIKVLPADLSVDPSRVKRFEKEARSASALNHPNIVTVYDIGTSDGLSYIAMERVDGETLRKLLDGGALPFRKLLPIAAQIADGLARAHEAGIVHRDLKPENVMVTRDGLVKILDFGLAKLSSTGSGSGEGSRLPTMTGTTPGVIMGTVGYMSPEQASGTAVDFRSDQFAFGAMLYEMVTGNPAFEGKTAIDTLGAILNEEPKPIGSVNPQAPTQLLWIVERCLAKEPRQRYSSTDDLARDLATLRDHLSEATSGGAPGASRPRRRSILWLLLGAAVVAIAAASLLRPRAPTAEVRAIRFSFRLPPKWMYWRCIAFSPDGSQLAFIAAAGGEAPRIWLRPLSAGQARAIPGTENVTSFFWSPDGHSLGFFAAGKLWRSDLSGRIPVPICDVWDVQELLTFAGTWGAGGEILFAPRRGEAIYRVSASGGKPAAIVKPDRAHGETTVTWPWFLPDGKSYLYLLRRESGAGSLMISKPDGSPRPIVPVESRVEYIDPGYLVFVREGTLMAQRFDARSGALSGEPLSIADSVGYKMNDGWANFGTSRDGAVAFGSRLAPREHLAWFDRSGHSEILGETGGYTRISLDPDGRRALFAKEQPRTGTHNLWILDLERKVETRITSDPTDEYSGLWLPDGKSIAYTAQRGGMVQLSKRDLATGRFQGLLPLGWFQEADAVMPGGSQLVYTNDTDLGNAETRLVSLSGDQKSSPLFQTSTAFNEAGVRFSPDGHFILFASTSSGRDEVYVAPMASPGERIRISSGGVVGNALWCRNGEIFYLSAERQLISVPVRTEPSLSPGKPVVLFTFQEGTALREFDVSPDGKRFLAVVSEGVFEEPPLNVVLNWTAEAATQGSSAR